MQEPTIHKALTTLEFLNKDKRTRELYEKRQKALMTYTADMEGAREEGEQIGIQEGRREEKRMVAKALLAAGDSVEKVLAITGLASGAISGLFEGESA